MQRGQNTDSTAMWSRSFATYVPPDFDLFDFDDDLVTSGVVRDLCAWRGRDEYPAEEVALSWACGPRKVLVSTRRLQEARWDTPREDVFRLARSLDGANALGDSATEEVAVRAAADDALWVPWVVPVDSGSLQRCEHAQVAGVMVGYGYRDDRIVLIAAAGGPGPQWALRTLTGERALTYITDPYAQVSGPYRQ